MPWKFSLIDTCIYIIPGRHAAILAVHRLSYQRIEMAIRARSHTEGSSRVEKCERTHLITAIADSRSGTWRDGRKSGLDRSIFSLKIDLPQYNPARISAGRVKKKRRAIYSAVRCVPKRGASRISTASRLNEVIPLFNKVNARPPAGLKAPRKARVARPTIEMQSEREKSIYYSGTSDVRIVSSERMCVQK